ncbi:hypothetical protein MKK67_04440 [Methylobacterium sp. J-072]|nr:hypothetical protein [Methylobacterium sp. J-072]
MQRRDALVFLDWDTVRRVAPSPRLPTETAEQATRHVESVFDTIRPAIADYLTALDKSVIYRVKWRIYHGWYSGRTKTKDLRTIEEFALNCRDTVLNKISFTSDIGLSHGMLCGGRRLPLFDTLRLTEEQSADGMTKQVERQKMVDTALICDLLQSTRSSKETIHLIFGDDDDLLPGVFMAETWGAQVHVLRRRINASRHVNTSGLITLMRTGTDSDDQS